MEAIKTILQWIGGLTVVCSVVMVVYIATHKHYEEHPDLGTSEDN